MISKAKEVTDYIESLPDIRKKALTEIRNVIIKNIPDGFSECINYGMPGYVVPHSIYPKGYHTDPKQPLPFIYIASQKNYISLHHMGIYGSEELLKWLIKEWPNYTSKKLNMGKGCIRFSKIEDIPLDLISKLVSKISPDEWIQMYEKAFRK